MSNYTVTVKRNNESLDFPYSDYGEALKSYMERVSSAAEVSSICPGNVHIFLFDSIKQLAIKHVMIASWENEKTPF